MYVFTCIVLFCVRVQGPTISHVYNLTGSNGSAKVAAKNYYAATICVRKKQLYGAVKALQKVSTATTHGAVDPRGAVIDLSVIATSRRPCEQRLRSVLCDCVSLCSSAAVACWCNP